MDIFTDSGGHEHIMGWGVCKCHVWYVAWQYSEYAGRCGRCGEEVRYCAMNTTKEQAYEVFKDVNGHEPEGFDD